jgi:hypothetical protein
VVAWKQSTAPQRRLSKSVLALALWLLAPASHTLPSACCCCCCCHPAAHHPVRWPAHEAEGYKWWGHRMARALALYDETRIDHFRLACVCVLCCWEWCQGCRGAG